MSFLAENPDVFKNFMWFVLGGCGYQLVKLLTGYLEIQNYVEAINRQTLYLVVRALEDKMYAANLKYAMMGESKISREIIEQTKKSDASELEAWKIQILGSFHRSYPEAYLRTIDPEDWKELFVDKGKIKP